MKKEEERKDGSVRVRRSPAFKLKDKANRNYQILKLSDFGFIPEVLIIEKVHRQTNTLVISAVLTDEEMKKEDKALKKLKVKENKHGRTTNKPASKEAGRKTSAKA